MFKEMKENLLSKIEKDVHTELKFPLPKIGRLINNYKSGEFIVVGGRKTSGRGYFILSNYIISPILQKQRFNKFEEKMPLNILYFSTKRSKALTMERMIISYLSNKKKGNKLSISSLYGYKGAKQTTRANAKNVISTVMNVFSEMEKDNVLDLVTSRHSIDALKEIIHDKMMRFGEFSSGDTVFTYSKEFKNQKTIIVVDDATGIIDENGNPAIKGMPAIALAMTLKEYSKVLNALIVLSVPCSDGFFRGSFYKGYLTTISPYDSYADRVLLLHNPVETSDETVYDYKMKEFINPKTGINYFRFIHIVSNYLGASGILFPLLLYPENGFFRELPKADDDIKMDEFLDIVLS